MTPGTAEHNKGKQRKELAGAETIPPNDASSIAEFDTNEHRTFWKFLRARGKDATTSPTQMTHGPSPKAVEVYAVRVTQVSFSHSAFARHYADGVRVNTTVHDRIILTITIANREQAPRE